MEIRYGVARLPLGRRRDALTSRIDQFLDSSFPGRILPSDRACARHYGDIRRAREASGNPVAQGDLMIAATARAHGASAIATRNISDFRDCGVALVNPWEAS